MTPPRRTLEEVRAATSARLAARLAGKLPRDRPKRTGSGLLAAIHGVGQLGLIIVAIVTFGFLVGHKISEGKRD